MKRGVELVKATFKDFSEDEATWKAAALAYYTVFALPPLLVLLLQMASAIWDPIEVRRALTGEFQSLMGQDVAGQLQTMIEGAEQKTSGTGLRLALSIGGLVFGATGAFVSLQSALNRAWEVEPDPKQGGIKNFITKRFLSLGMVLGIAFLLLVSLALTSVLSAAGGALFGGLPEAVGHAINFGLSFSVVTLLFALIFKLLPDAKIEWRDVWVGAAVTALLFVIGKFAIGMYIGRSDPGSAFGAASALAVLLVWIYYAAVIVLLGAEFTQAWVKQQGREIEPKEGAVRIIERKDRTGQMGEGSSERGAEIAGDSGLRRRRSDRLVAAGVALDATAEARRDIDATRQRLSSTITELETHVSGRIAGVKQKLDVGALVREHPLPAIAAAVVAGVALSASGADRKAAVATVRAAKRAPDDIRQGATTAMHAAADGAARLADVVVERIGRGSAAGELGDILKRGADELEPRS